MMKKLIFGLLFLAVGFAACTDDSDELSEVDPIKPLFNLPEGLSSADDRIVQMYEDYNSFFLYNYSDNALGYFTGVPSWIATKKDPNKVGEVLDFLDEAWIKHLNKEFHEKTMPYAIFLAEKYTFDYPYFTNGTWVIVYPEGLEAATKLSHKNRIWSSMLGRYINTLKAMVPSESFTALGGDYSKLATDMDDARKRGYMPRSFSTKTYNSLTAGTTLYDTTYVAKGEVYKAVDTTYKVADTTYTIEYKVTELEDKICIAKTTDWTYEYQAPNEWATSTSYMSAEKGPRNDFYYYIYWMTQNPSTWWVDYLKYPLIKQKYDLIRAYMISTYGFDPQKVGDLTFE